MHVENLFTVRHGTASQPPSWLCLQSKEIVSPMSTSSKGNAKVCTVRSSERQGKDGRGYLVAYNRRLTMSLPAAAERQFRVNSQNDGIRYPSYKLCCRCRCRHCFFLRSICTGEAEGRRRGGGGGKH